MYTRAEFFSCFKIYDRSIDRSHWICPKDASRTIKEADNWCDTNAKLYGNSVVASRLYTKFWITPMFISARYHTFMDDLYNNMGNMKQK